jgi:hypothetical protein
MADTKGTNLLDHVKSALAEGSEGGAPPDLRYLSTMQHNGRQLPIMGFEMPAGHAGVAVDGETGDILVTSGISAHVADASCVNDCLANCPDPNNPIVYIAWEAGCRKGCGG